MRESEQDLREQQLRWLHDMLMARTAPVFPDAWQDDATLRELAETLLEMRRATEALAGGDLHYLCHGHGQVIGMLKTLQANLRHLTWQVQCVAEGEYGQRVEFMGEFSEAFNSMTASLATLRRNMNALEEEYRQSLRRETLTGCYTVSAFQEILCAMLQKSGSGSLIRLELDYFADILTAGGADWGDNVLRSIGAAVRNAAKPLDVCCRTSDNAFMLAFPNMTCTQAAEKAEALRNTVEQLVFFCEGETVSVTISAGIVPLPAASTEQKLPAQLQSTYAQAKDAVCRAVALGRNQIFCVKSTVADAAWNPTLDSTAE